MRTELWVKSLTPHQLPVANSMQMPIEPTWAEIAVRLLLTLIAGAVIGFNREARGHAAGLRTTILVGLAAAVSMIQANVLLTVAGKASDSFGVMDLMRLPLGILTGVGFIGAGAILRRGDLIIGVTTAATLWIMTVIGLCLGGGQLALGCVATILAVITLWALRSLDIRIPREQRATIVVSPSDGSSLSPIAVSRLLDEAGYRARVVRLEEGERITLTFEVRWRQRERDGLPLSVLELLKKNYQIERFELSDKGGH
jgi:putative Mg2+ transporter-C (MgtC) family protein